MSGVLVVMEQQGGAWHRMSWETLAAGQQLAKELGHPAFAAVAGQGIGDLAAELGRKNLAKVHAVEHGLLKDYTADGFAAALEQLIKAHTPSYVLFPHTYQVRDFAPKLAARFGTTLISDVVSFHLNGGTPVFVRQLFQGKLNADFRAAGPGPVFASVQAGAYQNSSWVVGVAKAGMHGDLLDWLSTALHPFARGLQAQAFDRFGWCRAGFGQEGSGEMARAHRRMVRQPLDRKPLTQPLACPP